MKFKINATVDSTTYTIDIFDSIKRYGDYTELLKELDKISKKDSLVLNVSSPGGRCDVGFMLYEKLSNLECEVKVIVPYPSYSMGALLALCGDSLEIKPGAFIMFHDFSTRREGKGNEIVKSMEAYSEIFKHRFKDICQPFLSQKECENILNGQDLYVKWNDSSLESRLKRHFKQKETKC